MKRTDLVISLSFAALGAGLLLAGAWMPPGMGRLPGPGFFPEVVGAVILLLAAALFFVSLRKEVAGGFRLENRTALAATAALLIVYLALWGVVPFVLRTVVLLVVFLKMLGQRWRPALLVAVILTAAVVLAFQYGLRVDLG